MEELLSDFIEWAKENSPDAWYIYDNTEEAIEKYLKFKTIASMDLGKRSEAAKRVLKKRLQCMRENEYQCCNVHGCKNPVVPGESTCVMHDQRFHEPDEWVD